MGAIRTTIMDQRWAALPPGPLTSSDFLSKPGAEVVVIYFSSTTGGTYQVFYVDHTGVELAMTAPVVVLANQLVRDTFNGNVPQLRVAFTPSAFPGRAKAEVSLSKA